MVVFLDCRFIERKGTAPSKTKLFVNGEESSIKAVKMAVGKYVDSTAAEDIYNVFNRMKSVTCDRGDLTDFMIDDPN